MNREKAINLLESYFDDGTFFKDLSRRVAIETESQNPDKISKLYQYLSHEITPYLNEIGFDSKIYENPDITFNGPFSICTSSIGIKIFSCIKSSGSLCKSLLPINSSESFGEYHI